MVRRSPVHFLAFSAAPEVAAADDDADLHAHFLDFRDLIHHAGDHLFVQPETLFAGERFSRQFDNYSLILRFRHFALLAYVFPYTKRNTFG